MKLPVGSLHWDVPGFSQSLHCSGVRARHSDGCRLRTGDRPLLSLRGAPILSKLLPASPSSQPISPVSLSLNTQLLICSVFLHWPLTSPFPIHYSHSATDISDLWIRAGETSCLTLPKPLNFFVSACKLQNWAIIPVSNCASSTEASGQVLKSLWYVTREQSFQITWKTWAKALLKLCDLLLHIGVQSFGVCTKLCEPWF